MQNSAKPSGCRPLHCRPSLPTKPIWTARPRIKSNQIYFSVAENNNTQYKSIDLPPVGCYFFFTTEYHSVEVEKQRTDTRD